MRCLCCPRRIVVAVCTSCGACFGVYIVMSVFGFTALVLCFIVAVVCFRVVMLFAPAAALPCSCSFSPVSTIRRAARHAPVSHLRFATSCLFLGATTPADLQRDIVSVPAALFFAKFRSFSLSVSWAPHVNAAAAVGWLCG